MVEWPCCYDPLRLSLGSYDLFFKNISPPLSLLPPKSLGLGSRRAAKPPSGLLGRGSALPKISWVTEADCAKISWGTEVRYRKYPGERKTTAENILGHGSAVPKIILGNGRPPRKISWGAEVQYPNYPGSRKPTAGKYPGARKTTATRLRRSCRAKSRPEALLFSLNSPVAE